jgi:hypothetical protein
MNLPGLLLAESQDLFDPPPDRVVDELVRRTIAEGTRIHNLLDLLGEIHGYFVIRILDRHEAGMDN